MRGAASTLTPALLFVIGASGVGKTRAVQAMESRHLPDVRWAAYLRGQADALGLRVLETSAISVEEVADALAEDVVALRNAVGAS